MSMHLYLHGFGTVIAINECASEVHLVLPCKRAISNRGGELVLHAWWLVSQ